MAIIKCKACGGDIELTADKTYGMCEWCGSTMTFPKVDDEQRAAAFNRGNHFRRIGEFDKALAVYERIVREDDTDAEAHWCCALCRFGIEYVEDPATYEWLPTCHRASFDSFLEDVDYKAALEHSDGITRRQYQKDAAKIAEVQRGILATSQNTEPYDVFICYKESDANGNRTRDSLLAQDIYYQLTEQGRKVFFARITLEDIAGAQYEPYIFAALNSAKVMIVVGTKPEYLNAVWVKNEWSRFLAMMKKDHSKLLLPCYRDMDPYDMPEALSVLQSYDMSKIGFIQDLTRGISKVLNAEMKTEKVSEPVIVQQVANSNITALLKRGNMALEDAEWDKADQFYEDVLNQDAECVEAYLGKLMARFRIHKQEDLSMSTRAFAADNLYQRAVRFASAQQSAQLKRYADENKMFLLKQGELLLQEEQWAKATNFFDEVLVVDESNAQAYVGKFLANTRGKNLSQSFAQMLDQLRQSVTTTLLTGECEETKQKWLDIAYKNYLDTGMLRKSDIDSAFPKVMPMESAYSYWEDQFAELDQLYELYPNLHCAMTLADDTLRYQIEEQITMLKDAVKMHLDREKEHDEAAKMQAREANCRSADQELARIVQKRVQYLDEQYRELCTQQEKFQNDIWRLRSLKNAFFNMGHYRDCRDRVKAIEVRIDEIEKQQKERQKNIEWMAAGKCKHCGGEFRGVFNKKCVNCGKVKDYGY